MRYASVCDGIGAAHVAWLPLGWECAWHAEINPFPAAVVAHRLGDRAGPNLGDITKITQEQTDALGPIDLLVGGTPCQSFSVAGLRRGMDDPRGNLALVFLRLAARTRARWIVWENVPGVLSSAGGRDFGSFLGALGELGYGWSYRVLDAQYVRVEPHARAVPQQRRRVFVVGHLGDWRPPAAVLLERESVQGHPEPRRETGEVPPVAAPLGAKGDSGYRQDLDHETYVARRVSAGEGKRGDYETCTIIPQAVGFNWQSGGDCRIGGTDGRTDALQRSQVPAVTFMGGMGAKAGGIGYREESSPTLGSVNSGNQSVPTIAIQDGRGMEKRQNGCGIKDDGSAYTVDSIAAQAVATAWSVRRLTPRECERLQAFPDDWTLIPWRKGLAKDAPRYKAIGNSMATNVMSWLGKRIDAVERIVQRREP